MLHLIPAPLHRALLCAAHRVRHSFRKVVKPDLTGVSVIVTDGQGSVLLVRHSYGSSNWAVPGGGCHRDENPQTCARREMEEELALDLADLRLLRERHETISGSPHTAYIFTATANNDPMPDNREIVAARFFDPDRLPEKIDPISAGRIALWRKLRR